MSSLSPTLRAKPQAEGAKGIITLALGTLVAIAVTVLFLALLSTTHQAVGAASHGSSVAGRALGLSGTPGPASRGSAIRR